MVKLLTLEPTETGKVRFATPRARIGHHDAMFAEPFPLWPVAARRRFGPASAAPAIIEYSSDEFMQQFLMQIGVDPNVDRVDSIQPGVVPTARQIEERAEVGNVGPIKLFQPFHGRFYLVACSFVCGLVGHPDRALKSREQESLFFVIRRRRVLDGVTVEEAWIPEHGWVAGGTPDAPRPVAREERLRLAALRGLDGRDIWYGYLRTASRETYVASDDDPLLAGDESVADIAARIRDELVFLREQHGREESAEILGTLESLLAPTDEHEDDLTPIEQQQEELKAVIRSRLALSTLSPIAGTWLSAINSSDHTAYDLTRLPVSAWQALRNAFTQAITLDGVTLVGSAPFPNMIPASIADLRTERWVRSFDWLHSLAELLEYQPELYSVLAMDPPVAEPSDVLADEALTMLTTMRELDVQTGPGDAMDSLATAFNTVSDSFVAAEEARSVPPISDKTAPQYNVASLTPDFLETMREDIEASIANVRVPKYPLTVSADGPVFVVRCVYERACCTPARVLFSDASVEFGPAPVFDAQAPARLIQIPLPADPGELKKMARGVAILMSNRMRSKIMKRKGLDAPFNKGPHLPNFSVGVACSLSIPIVTICAFILLMIIASILHFIFRWLPYLFVCFPIRVKPPTTSP